MVVKGSSMCRVERAATRFPEYVVTMTRNTSQKLTQNMRADRVPINLSSPSYQNLEMSTKFISLGSKFYPSVLIAN